MQALSDLLCMIADGTVRLVPDCTATRDWLTSARAEVRRYRAIHSAGGQARAARLTPERRAEIARAAGTASAIVRSRAKTDLESRIDTASRFGKTLEKVRSNY